MGSESEERPEQKVFCRAEGAGGEAEGLGLEKWKKMKICSLTYLLASSECPVVSQECLLE